MSAITVDAISGDEVFDLDIRETTVLHQGMSSANEHPSRFTCFTCETCRACTAGCSHSCLLCSVALC